MNKKPRWKAVPALLLALGLAGPAVAQMVTATLTGTVKDSTGGALVRADVMATNQGTGLEYPTKTNDAGMYTITGLPIGTYVLKAEAASMKTGVSTPVVLEVGQVARLDVVLELGVRGDEIEITSAAPILQRDTTSVGATISGTTAVALPLNGRNFAQLTLLTPGAQHHDPQSFTVPGGVSGGRPYVNGHREQGNNFMLDGIDMNEAMDNLLAYNPSPDALAE